MKRYFSPLCLVWCATACGFASSAMGVESAPDAALTLPFVNDTQAAAIPVQVVDDDVLANQTGKYADASMISGFVLNLLSQWQLPNGALAIAQGSLTVAANAANQLSAQVSTLAKVINGYGPSGANPGSLAIGGQTVSVNGVSQVTQVAGNGNGGTNSALIDFNSTDPQPAMLPGASSSPTAFASNSTGTIKAGIAFASNGIALSLATPAGLATQTVVPSAAQQAGAIAQLLQIAGNKQIVSNQLQLQLQTQQMSSSTLRQMGILQALQNSVVPRR
ncbi:peptidase C39 [Burkholderia alba]|uniref:peptidase C39 n=1 Tax=Burkholderia alba TaxID=2683677 RepID=UPI002B0556D0|nr:peptidase C39 [Burkholderia alba]